LSSKFNFQSVLVLALHRGSITPVCTSTLLHHINKNIEINSWFMTFIHTYDHYDAGYRDISCSEGPSQVQVQEDHPRVTLSFICNPIPYNIVNNTEQYRTIQNNITIHSNINSYCNVLYSVLYSYNTDSNIELWYCDVLCNVVSYFCILYNFNNTQLNLVL
jgi:hypothetical protein